MQEIIHRIGIACSPQEVFKALTTDDGLSRWWTTDTSGAGGVGAIIRFRFNGAGPDFEVIEQQQDTLVRWKHSGEMPGSWVGTEISFQLSKDEKQTYVLFVHSGWKEQTDFMGHCSTKWAIFLISLKDALETGTGKPFPNDIQIDHN